MPLTFWHFPAYVGIFFWLLVFHVLVDGPLQIGELAKMKASKPGAQVWFAGLIGHATLHGGAVALVTGWLELGIAELVAHALIDALKAYGRIGWLSDQILHILCKLVWVAILVGGVRYPSMQGMVVR